MWDLLVKLADRLPGETAIYCGHEYTEANARFAMTIEPNNVVLKDRVAEVARQRAAGQATLPTTMALELAANPFLRAEEPQIQAALGMSGADPAAVFAEIRGRKDRFRTAVVSPLVDEAVEAALHLGELRLELVEIGLFGRRIRRGGIGCPRHRRDERREHAKRLGEGGQVCPCASGLPMRRRTARRRARRRRRGSPPREISAARR